MERLNIDDFDCAYGIMAPSFPEDELRPYGEQRALLSDSAYRLYGLREEGRLVSVLAVREYGALVYLEHFATDPALRGRGIGGRLLDEFLASSSGTVFLEAEPPSDGLTLRRIAFYERHGFVLNPYPYVQPPISEGRSPVPLRIMTYGRPIGDEDYREIRETLYRRVYHCEP